MKPMYVLGLSAFHHDSAAALLGEQGVVAALEESKLVRVPGAGGIPRAAVKFCLDRAGITWKDIACIAVATNPVRNWARQAALRLKLTPVAPVASIYYQVGAVGELTQDLNAFRHIRLMRGDARVPVHSLEHGLCHAASAFFASPYERALILVMDEYGDGWPGLVAVGEGTRIRVLRSIPYPHSPAWVYSQITQILGFTAHSSEHKTQWLSLEAEPAFRDLFVDLLRHGSGPLPRLNSACFTRGYAGRVAFSSEFYRRLGASGKPGTLLPAELRAPVASSLQEACAVVVSDLAEEFRRQTGAEHLCLAGGLFLNGPLVVEIEKRTGFRQVFAHPAAGNAGTSLGAATLAWHEQLRKPRLAPTMHLNWGPVFNNEEIKSILHNCKAYYRWCDTDAQKIDAVIQLLKAGKIVGWYQGAAEFGPRALGNRSLLASPWAAYVKNNLNDYIKHREWFRPFALAVPEEDAGRHFEYSPSTYFMASLGRVREPSRHLVESFLLPGGRARLQVVREASNPLFWKLLKRFGESEPAPFLVNTSFNLFGEPLVVSPRDAVRSYFSSGIDALMIGNFLLSKDAILIAGPAQQAR